MLATCPECETEAYHASLDFQTEGGKIRFQFKCRDCDHVWWSDPAGLAVLIKKEGMAELCLVCPGCWDLLLDGQSEDCSCYEEVSDEETES